MSWQRVAIVVAAAILVCLADASSKSQGSGVLSPSDIAAQKEKEAGVLASYLTRKAIGLTYRDAPVRPSAHASAVPRPTPGKGEVVVDIRASQLNKVEKSKKTFNVKWQPTMKIEGVETCPDCPSFTCKDFNMQYRCDPHHQYMNQTAKKKCYSIKGCRKQCCQPMDCRHMMKAHKCAEGYVVNKLAHYEWCKDGTDCKQKCCRERRCCDWNADGGKCTIAMAYADKAKNSTCYNEGDCQTKCCAPKPKKCSTFYKEDYCPVGFRKREQAEPLKCRGRLDCISKCCCQCEAKDCGQFQCNVFPGFQPLFTSKAEAKSVKCMGETDCKAKCCTRPQKQKGQTCTDYLDPKKNKDVCPGTKANDKAKGRSCQWLKGANATKSSMSCQLVCCQRTRTLSTCLDWAKQKPLKCSEAKAVPMKPMAPTVCKMDSKNSSDACGKLCCITKSSNKTCKNWVKDNTCGDWSPKKSLEKLSCKDGCNKELCCSKSSAQTCVDWAAKAFKGQKDATCAKGSAITPPPAIVCKLKSDTKSDECSTACCGSSGKSCKEWVDKNTCGDWTVKTSLDKIKCEGKGCSKQKCCSINCKAWDVTNDCPKPTSSRSPFPSTATCDLVPNPKQLDKACAKVCCSEKRAKDCSVWLSTNKCGGTWTGKDNAKDIKCPSGGCTRATCCKGPNCGDWVQGKISGQSEAKCADTKATFIKPAPNVMCKLKSKKEAETCAVACCEKVADETCRAWVDKNSCGDWKARTSLDKISCKTKACSKERCCKLTCNLWAKTNQCLNGQQKRKPFPGKKQCNLEVNPKKPGAECAERCCEPRPPANCDAWIKENSCGTWKKKLNLKTITCPKDGGCIKPTCCRQERCKHWEAAKGQCDAGYSKRKPFPSELVCDVVASKNDPLNACKKLCCAREEKTCKDWVKDNSCGTWKKKKDLKSKKCGADGKQCSQKACCKQFTCPLWVADGKTCPAVISTPITPTPNIMCDYTVDPLNPKNSCVSRCCGPVKPKDCQQWYDEHTCGKWEKIKNDLSTIKCDPAKQKCKPVCCKPPSTCKTWLVEQSGKEFCKSKHKIPMSPIPEVKCKGNAECEPKCCESTCELYFHKNKDSLCSSEERPHHKFPTPQVSCDIAGSVKDKNSCAYKCCRPKPDTCVDFLKTEGCLWGWTPRKYGLKSKCSTKKKWGFSSCYVKCCRVPLGVCYYWGDPHITTFDGLKYNCYGEGEYLVYRNKNNKERVHSYQKKHPTKPTPPYNRGLAWGYGKYTLFLRFIKPEKHFELEWQYRGEKVSYNGEPFKMFGPYVLTRGKSWPGKNWSPSMFKKKKPGFYVYNVMTGTGYKMKFYRSWKGLCGVDLYVHPMRTAQALFQMLATKLLAGSSLLQEVEQRQAAVQKKTKKVSFFVDTEGLCGIWDGKRHTDCYQRDKPGSFCKGYGKRISNKNANPACLSWMVKPSESLFSPLNPPKAMTAYEKSLLVATPMASVQQMCGSQTKYISAKQSCEAKVPQDQVNDCVTEICVQSDGATMKNAAGVVATMTLNDAEQELTKAASKLKATGGTKAPKDPTPVT